MSFVWIVPAAAWFLVHFMTEACSKGNLPSSRLARATAEVCDKGNMTANTASCVRPGTSITLSCQLKPPRHSQQCRIAIFINSSELISNHSGSVSADFLVHTYGKHMFTCKIVCEYKRKLICGMDIESGSPPDEPRNVSCIQHGRDGHPTCTWEKGRLTHINTTYLIQLSNETDVLCVSEESLDKKIGSLALSKLNFDSTYTLVVAASNDLGSAFSQPLVFTLIDIVQPHPPNFLVEFENSSATSCTLLWQHPAQAQRYRLRYRPLTRHTWSTKFLYSLFEALLPSTVLQELSAPSSAGDWVPIMLTCSLFLFAACVCSAPPARKALHWLLSSLVPQWQSEAIPDPANASWAKSYLARKAELSLPSSLPHSSSSFEEPKPLEVEETFVKTEPLALRDKLLPGRTDGHWPVGSSSSQEEPEYRALPGSGDGDGDGDGYEQQLPDLYKRLALEVTEHSQSVEYIANPVPDPDPGPAHLPPASAQERPELQCPLLSPFPRALLPPALGCEGNLRLDSVKIECGSFTR
ncbi:uncharacterized protein LJ264_006092 [Porphyrio hochstetteri]